MQIRNATHLTFTAARGAVHTQLVARAPAFTPVAAPTRLLQLARPDSSTRSIFQARHYSSADASASTDGENGSSSVAEAIATLWPPWQVSELPPLEQKAYEKHGPGYISHLSEAQQRKSLRAAEKRRRLEKYLKSEHGETHWYGIQKEAFKRFLEIEKQTIKDRKRRYHELTQGPNATSIEAKRAKEEIKEEGQRWLGERLEKLKEIRRQVAEEFKQREAE